MIHEEEREGVREALTEVGRAVAPEILFRIEDAAGGHRWMHAVFSSVERAGVGEENLRIYLTDVTQCKNSQAALEEADVKYQSLFNEAHDAILILSDGIFVDCNPRSERMFDRDRDRIIGRKPADVSPEFQRDGERSEVKQDRFITPALSGEPQFFEWQHTRGDGSVFDAEVSLNRVRLREGTHIQATVRDVTARVAAENAMRESESRLARVDRSRVETLLALHETGVDLSAERDLDKLLRAIVDRAERLVGASMGGLYLTQDDGSLKLIFADGALGGFIGMELAPGEGVCGNVFLTREPMVVSDYGAWPGKAAAFDGVRVGSIIGAPILWDGEVLGALHVGHEAPDFYGRAEVEVVNLFAEKAAVAIANARLFSELERANEELSKTYDATLEGWVHALDLRDKETEGHTQRVTEKAVRLARRMGVEENDLVHIRRGALLHDIGKIGIPDRILLKSGPLTEDEMTIMRGHTMLAHEMLSGVPYLRKALEIPTAHHERWDGAGYPRGLKGERIPLSARIFAVVDVADALSYDRPYRGAWERTKVLEHVRLGAGSHFDSNVVEEFLTMEAEDDTVS